MGEGSVRKKPFYAKRSLRKGDSWKVTCDIDVVFSHTSKPRGGSEKDLYTLRGKTEKKFCSIKDDGTGNLHLQGSNLLTCILDM